LESRGLDIEATGSKMIYRHCHNGPNQPGGATDPQYQNRQPQDLVGVHRKLRISDSNLNIAAGICSM
jgi:hypothetical protein